MLQKKLTELNTDNIKDYEEMALRISNNPEKLKQLKVRILENKISSNVFKPQVYTHNIEKGYRKVYENYIDGQKPQNFKL